MGQPWESDGQRHDTYETDSGFIKCRRCGKMATAKGKLKTTRCEDG